jgi:hypothetical protein
MGMSICLETRDGKATEEIPDLESLLSRFFPSWDDQTYHFLRYIDPWGETVFNHLQMDELIFELRRIRSKASSEEQCAFVDAIEGMAGRCKDGDGLYLKFIGD